MRLQEQDDTVAAWSGSTITKIKQVLTKILVENGYLDSVRSEIKVIDPCMGSGHILVYMFDVLVQIYEAYDWDSFETSWDFKRRPLI